MRHHIARCRVDPVLAPDQFSVARPLRPEDLDRRVTRQGVYPSLPAPNGIPWSEYVRTYGNKPQSISSSMEALESDHARFVTRTIAQYARTMATHTRSLPTDSPVPFLPIERRHMSEGSLRVSHLMGFLLITQSILVVLITTLRSQKQIECQPLWVWMIMTPSLLLNMTEEL